MADCIISVLFGPGQLYRRIVFEGGYMATVRLGIWNVCRYLKVYIPANIRVQYPRRFMLQAMDSYLAP